MWPTSRTINSYVWRDGAVSAGIVYDGDSNNPNDALWITNYGYEIIGGQAQMRTATIADGRPRTVTFVSDFLGQVIRRDEKDNLSGGDPHEIWYRFSGRQQAYVGNNGTIDIDYLNSVPQEQGGGPAPASVRRFDLAYNPINAYEQGSRGGMYSVQSGDTLAGIASALWGDASLWYKIAEANGLTADSPLLEGMSLIIPAGVQSNSNNATHVQTLRSARSAGRDQPDIAEAAKSQMRRVRASAAGGDCDCRYPLPGSPVLGDVVSQVVGVATGIQDKFHWNQVGMTALTSFVSRGLQVGERVASALSIGNELASAAVSYAVNNAVAQGIGVATGMQSEFSWAGVAAAGVGGAGRAMGGQAFAGRGRQRIHQRRRTIAARELANVVAARWPRDRRRRDAKPDRWQRFRRQHHRQPARCARPNHRGGDRGGELARGC